MILGKTVTLFNDRSTQPVASGASLIYTATFFDENGIAISAADITALTLSVVDTKTGVIINGVDEQDILNNDRGEVDAGGELTIVLEPDDTVLANTKYADRSLILKWVYGLDNRIGRHQVDFRVLSLSGDA